MKNTPIKIDTIRSTPDSGGNMVDSSNPFHVSSLTLTEEGSLRLTMHQTGDRGVIVLLEIPPVSILEAFTLNARIAPGVAQAYAYAMLAASTESNLSKKSEGA